MPPGYTSSPSTLSNPAHILIGRNNRTFSSSPHTSSSASPHHHHSSPADPLQSTIAASGTFPRQSASPPWLFEDINEDEQDNANSGREDGGEATPIDVDSTFTKEGRWPGTVKIVVEATTFWAHRDILVFASPFFEAALSGRWSETSPSNRPASTSSIITISQPPTVPGEPSDSTHPQINFTTVPSESDSDPDAQPFSLWGAPQLHITTPSQFTLTTNNNPSSNDTDSESDIRAVATEEQKSAARARSLEKLVVSDCASEKNEESANSKTKLRVKRKRRSKTNSTTEGIIVLKEERATIFHDFLKFIYPHLECTIAWNNVEGLMNISDKLVVPQLQAACLNFLLTHAAGKPIKALRIAELFDIDELYKEASRFVLENPGGWSEGELSTLSKETLLKLEKRRNWFLERVLKIGLVSIAKEYQCCPTCPDPHACARCLEEKWRHGYQSLFRFGPAQPSMVFRYLRSLEGVGPPLALKELSCQNHAKQWTATLFDRMFSLGVRGSGSDASPLNARVVGGAAGVTVAAAPGGTGLRRHFLYCSLKPEIPPPKSKGLVGKAREAGGF